MNTRTSPARTATQTSPARPTTYGAGVACVLGAVVLTLGGVATQVAAAGTSVSDQVWHYPWKSGTFVAITVLFALAQGLLVVGVGGLRRSGAAGSGRTARTGLALAVTGTAVIVVGHLVSIPVREQAVDDAGAVAAGLAFLLGTVLSAVGFLLAGAATLRTTVWRDAWRFVPLAIGIWLVAMLGLQFTPFLPTAAAVLTALFVALGIALVRPPTSVVP
ncbi:hypothetical protein [Modestobacter sp. URMC 112]